MAADEPFKLLIESVKDHAIFMLDPAGVVRSWNPGAHALKQYTADEIIGRHFSIFYPPEEVQAGKCALELKVAERTGRFEDEGWRVRKDGTRFWANVVITAIRAPDGSLRGFAKITRDLTDRRRAEEELRQSELRLRLLLESIADYAVFMLDASGHVTTWNTGAQRIKQYRADEIIGQHFSRFYPREALETQHPQRVLEVATATGRYEEEGWRVRKDGSRFWANVVISAVRNAYGQLVGFAKVTRDLTERKEAERERAARLAAEEANRAKDEFLAMLGHELRNPLAPTLTALQVMKLRGDLRSSAEQEIIERQVRHMVRLVDDLLDLSRVARGTLELRQEPIDLRDTLARGLEIVAPMIEDRRHQLHVDVPSTSVIVNGDRTRLAQVFANLLCNAAKYTDPGGTIHLSVQTDGGQVITTVRDNGVGIAPDLLPRVFESFVQAPQSISRSSGGLGIGLSLVRSFVERHGGTVEGRSPGVGRGSTFIVKLPLAQQTRSVEPSAREPQPVAVRPVRVLLVDDNEDSLTATAEVLRMAGHEVFEATSATAALEALATSRPDVALLDIGLPDLDGYELARRLRELLASQVPALIAMTGYGQASDRERAHQAGFDLHLVKPVDVDELLRRVQQLGIARAQAALTSSA